MKVNIQPSICYGSLQVPSSKSLSHRALICAGLAEGTSHIDHLSSSRDILATIDCLRALGADVQYENQTAVIVGCNPAKLRKDVVLDAYESGSTLRFFIPIASTGHERVTFKGQPSLLDRPMGVYADLFLAQNLVFHQSPEQIVIEGPLESGLFQMPGDVSSQFVSGILFAAPLMHGETTIAVLPPYQSKSYVNLTMDMMQTFGIRIEQPTSHAYVVPALQSYYSQNVTIEGDFSQLAFFGVLAALQNQLTLLDMNPASLQGDKVILDFLKQAGADICWENHQDILIKKHSLNPLTIDLEDCPDLGPILCVLSAYIPGQTKIINCQRLRYKESDRIQAMEEELRKWGVDITSDENTITINGKPSYHKEGVVEIDSHNDHRIAMAMTIFGLCAQSPSTILNAQAVDKSYPDFFRDIEKIHGKVEVL